LFLSFWYATVNDHGATPALDFAGYYGKATPAVMAAYAAIGVGVLAVAQVVYSLRLRRGWDRLKPVSTELWGQASACPAHYVTAASSTVTVPASASSVAITPIGMVSFCSMCPNDSPEIAGIGSEPNRSRRISSRLNVGPLKSHFEQRPNTTPAARS